MSKLSKIMLQAGLLGLALLLTDRCLGASRVIRAENMTVARGATNRLYITLESLGDESAMGFSLGYDTNQLTFIRAFRGSSATNNFDLETYPLPALTTNIIHAASKGLLGIAVNLDVSLGQVWPAGSNRIVEVHFRAATNGGTVITPVWFTNFPIARGVSDGDAGPLSTTFVDASVTVLGGCVYSFNTNSASFSAAAGSGYVNVTADVGCAWTVNNTNSWITITSSTNGSGNGTVNYTVAANTNFSGRSATFTIAGQTVTVNQAAYVCAYSISPTTRNHGYGTATNTVEITTGACSWTISNLNSWISFPAGTNGTGSATNTYIVAANPNLVSRTGIVMIGGQVLTIVQDPFPCDYTLSPTKRSHGASANSNSFIVTTTLPLCDWTATTTNSWLTLVTGTNGPGSNTVGYLIAANPDAAPRYGAFFVQDQIFSITQAAASCTAELTPTSVNHGFGSVTGLVTVAIPNGCVWTVDNTNSWITITSGGSGGTGSGTLGYAVQANTNVTSRFGVITIGSNSFNVTQSGAVACTFTISPTTRKHGSGAATNTVRVTPIDEGCSWTISNLNTWITFPAGTNFSGTVTNTYWVAANPDPISRTGFVMLAGKTFIVTQDPGVCTYTVAPTSQSHGSGSETGLVTVTAFTTCAWTATTNASWIKITSGTSGTGNGSVGYAVEANTNAAARTGTLTIGGKTVTLTQNGTSGSCTFTLSPTKRTHGPGAANNSVDVRALPGCAWTASTTNLWLSFVGATNGTGSNTVNYAVLANPDPIERVGSLLIAGQTFVITQQALICSYTVSPTNRSHGFSAATNTITVTPNGTGCDWDATTTNNWITLSGGTNGPGSNTVTYVLAANTDSASRTGIVSIADRIVTISQDGVPGCSFTLSPTKRTHGPGAASDSVDVRTQDGCAWTASTTNSWLTFPGATNGTGSNTVNYSVAANPNPVERYGSLLIGGQTFVITQQAVVCSYTISPTNRNHGFGAATNTIVVTPNGAGCDWNATTTNSWITLSGATNGPGSNTVIYVLAENTSLNARTGTVFIANRIVTISQDGSPGCDFTISPTKRTHGPGGGANSVDVRALPGCEWTASTTNAWLSFTGATNGSGSNTVNYLVAANPNELERVGSLLIAGQTFVITQQALVCSYSVSPTNRSHGFSAATNTIIVTPNGAGCDWNATTTNNWITLSGGTNGPGSNTVIYVLAANTAFTDRTGVVAIADRIVTITQDAAPGCTFTLSPTKRTHGPGAATNSVIINTTEACAWTASTTNSWLTLTGLTNGIGSNVVSYSVAANPNPIERVGSLLIDGQTFVITQQALVCSITLSPSQRAHGPGAATNTVNVDLPATCNWTASTTNSWLTFVGATNGTGSNAVTYAVAANPNPAERIGGLLIGDQTFVITQRALVCSITVSPTNRSHGHGSATNSITVLANGAGCSWTASTLANWISLTGTNGSGDGAVAYVLAENQHSTGRTGLVMVAEATLTIVQDGAPCTYDISPTNRIHGFARTTNSVALDTLDDCPWTVLNTNSWITIASATNGVGSNNISYIVEANPLALWRTGVVMIANQPFTIAQQPLPCVFTLNPANASYSYVATNGSFSVTTSAECSWTVATAQNWITITSTTNGAGLGTVTYTVAGNPTGASRVGQISVGDKTFQITQQGQPCTFTVAPLVQTHSSSSGAGTVNVTTLTGCDWTASTTNAWITFTSPTNNSGSGTLQYAVGMNNSFLERVGFISVADKTVTITQQAAVCVYTIEPTNRQHSASIETGTVVVATSSVDCPWNVISMSPWIQVISATSGAGNGIVSYRVLSNNTALVRHGVLEVAGEDFAIAQLGAPCSFLVASNTASHGSGIENGQVSVTTLTGCVWTVSNSISWITLNSPLNNTNSGVVSYTVQSNNTALVRSGIISVAGQNFAITQSAANCSFLLASNAASHGSGIQNGQVSVTTLTGCVWTVSNSISWITINSSLNNSNSGVVSYTLQSNNTALARSGIVSIAGQNFTVTQSGANCSFLLASNTASHGPSPANGQVSVTTLTGCVWTVVNPISWITINSPLNNTNSGVVSYSVLSNEVAIARTGVVSIAGQNFTIAQAGAPCTFLLSSNFASHSSGTEAGLISVTTVTGCTWTPSTTNSWITILSGPNHTNSGLVSYSVVTNPTALIRVGSIKIDTQTFTITQAGAGCSYSLSTNSASHGAGVEVGSMTVNTLTGCTWTVQNSTPWISILSSTNATNGGSVIYSVATNVSSIARTGTLTIAGSLFTVMQAGANCTYSLASNSAAFSSAAANGSVTLSTLTGCVWTVSSGVSWITINSPVNNTNSRVVSYSVLSNDTAVARTGVVSIANLNFTVTQAGASCSFLLASNIANHGPSLESGQVSVTTLAGCGWTVSNSISWITINSPLTNTGSGIVNYSVLTNGTALSRTGIVSIAGQNFSIRQSGTACTFTLSSNSASYSVNAATGSVSLTTLTGCSWTATTTNAWITIISASSNLNSGVVTYSISSNSTVFARTGAIQIDGHVFTVTQAGVPCSLSLSWSNWVHSSLAESGVIGVIGLTGCAWNPTTTNAWLTIPSTNGSGSGNLSYAVAENTDGASRTGAVNVAGINFVIAQVGTNCSYLMAPTTRFHGNGANSNTISITVTGGCPWAVLNTNSWITILSNAVGSGSQTIGYGIARNNATTLRSGVVNVAGEILAITQWGTDCGFVLTPNNRTHGSAPETNSAAIKASSSSCSRSASNTNSWIVIISVSPSTGDGTVTYRTLANTNATPRVGVFTVGGVPFTVTQSAAPCSFALSSTNAVYNEDAANGSVSVTTGLGCTWSVVNNNPWITIANGLNHTNNDIVSYSVAENTTAFARTGVVSIAGQDFTVTQSGAACEVLLAPLGATHGNGAEAGSVTVTMSLPGCTWNATTTNPWITIVSGGLGTNAGNVGYSILANDAAAPRTGAINIAGQNFIVTQAAANCSFTILPANAAHGSGMETGSVAVTTFTGCAWTAVSNDPWITVLSGANSANNGSMTYRVSSNQTVVARTGSITIAGKTFTITQIGKPCTFTLSPPNAVHSFGPTNSSFSISTSNECNWTVLNTNSWITITSATNGTGNATVTYSVATNESTIRTGYLLVGNAAFPVTQSGSVRIVRALDMNLSRGQTNRMLIVLESLGNESALGFSLSFDPNELNFVQAVRGAVASNLFASLNVNTSAVAQGRVGVSVGLDVLSGQVFPEGSNVIAEFLFRGTAGTAFTDTPVRFTNSPIATDISDADATPLPAIYLPGTVHILGNCTFTLSTNAMVFASAGGNGSFNVISQVLCPWTVVNPNSWIHITSATSSSGNGTVTFTVDAHNSTVGRTGIVTIATQTFIVIQDRTPCFYTISPTSRTHTPSPETGSIHVTATNSCDWTVNNTNAWITITSATNGTDSGDVTYSVSSNSFVVARSGVIVIAGQPFTVTQSGAPCAFTIAPTSKSHGFGSETGLVAVTSSNGCAWIVDNTNSWVFITSATSGSGSGNVTYTLEYNPSASTRVGVVTIAAKQYTITQAANTCPVTLSPTNRNHSGSAQTNSFNVTNVSACAWIVSNTNTWISILSSTNGTGNATVTYSLAANLTGALRTGMIRVSGKEFTVVQTNATCSFSITPTTASRGFGMETGSVTLTATVPCNWTAVSSNNWITITPTSGAGSSNFTYVVSANPGSFARTGIVNIAGQILTVIQAGAPCSYSLSATSVVWNADGNIGDVTLTAPLGCNWTITNSNSWISTFADINGQTNGSGGTTLYYVLDANPSGTGRTGQVWIANQLFTVRQLGQPCNFILSATEVTHGPGNETNTLGVTTFVGCNWAVINTNSWITILSGISYSGSGGVQYRVSTNTTGIERSGVITVAGQPVTITQNGTPCTYTLSTNFAAYSYNTVTGLVSIITTNNCAWTIANTNPWIAIKAPAALAGTNNGIIRYTVAVNSSPVPRSGNIVIGGLVHTVSQFGAPCTYTLSSSGRFHGSGSETGQVTVVAVPECSWTIDNTNNWITIVPTNGAGTTVISYYLQANPSATDRSGTFIIGDQLYTVLQFGAACNYALSTTNVFHGGLAETGSVDVAAPMGCNWTVTEALNWVTILSGATGTNIGTVRYSILTNVTGVTRGGVITIGNGVSTTSLAITQAPVACSFSVTPTNVLHGFEADNGTISVTTSNICPWNVIETNTWISFTSSTNNVGSVNLSYSITANPSGTPRTGVVMVAGQAVTIRQAGLVCSYTLSPGSLAHEFLAATGQVAVAAPTLCSWSVSNTNGWITLLTGANFTGSNTVRYSISNNLSVTPRSGFITIAGQPFSVMQNGLPFIAASNKTVLCNTAWDFDAPVLTGNCGTPGSTVLVVSTVTNTGCGATFTATRIWDATDACGSRIMATQTVSVATQPPIITCAPDKTVECGSIWTFNAPTATEYCGGSANIAVVNTVTNAVGMCGNTFIVTRTWRATDACGNQSTCSQSVHVVDTTPPTVFCAPDKTVECGSPWTFNSPTATDSCGGTNVLIRVFSSVTNSSGTCGFTVTRVWEIFDACTNRSTCSQTVTVIDTTPPVLTCAATKTVECGTAWNFDPPTANDNCSGTNVTILVWSTLTNAIGLCGNTFMTMRTWEVIDDCGNINFCSQTVRLIDTTAPVPVCAPNKTIEFGQAWDFDAPTGTDSCGGTNVTVRIVSTATNTSGFCSPTFSATRTWEIADGCSNKVNCTQTVTVRDTTAPVISCAANKTVNCLQPWTFDFPSAVDIASGTNLTITIVNTTTNGSCGSGFTATRTWRVTDACGNNVTCSQIVSGRAVVSVNGTVYSPTNYPSMLNDRRVAGATILGPTNTSTLSAADGSFSAVFEAASNVVITPLAPTGGNPADGITTLDISLVRRHILSVSNLDSPYKLLAADVDASGAVSTLDLSFMRRLILGVTNRFPAGMWRFVPANYAFPNVLSPWMAPTNRPYGGVASELTGQDFAALKLGDVNNSWAPAVGDAPAKAAVAKDAGPVVSFRVNGGTVLPGSTVVVQVTVGGFRQVTSAQAALSWDPSVLRFVGTEGYSLDGLGAVNFGTNAIATGKLVFSWDDPVAQGVTLPDDSGIFAVRFDVIGTAGSISPVALMDSILVREVGVNFTPATFQAIDGQVQVMERPRIAPGTFTQNSFGLNIPTVSGKRYTLEYTDVVPATNWIALPTVVGDGTVKALIDPAPAVQKRFYRVKVE